MITHLLFEFASGYALFEKVQGDIINVEGAEMQNSLLDLEKFGKILKLKSFYPFKDPLHALTNINDISEGLLNEYLREMLEVAMEGTKKSKVCLGVQEKALAGAIKAALGFECEASTEVINEFIRAVRFHSHKLFAAFAFKQGDFERAQLGLGHSYSRAKVKFNVNRADNMIIQSICLLDQLDKDINTLSQRVREWYSWHFPELAALITSATVSSTHNAQTIYAKAVQAIGDKKSISERIPALEQALDGQVATETVLEAARSSMGTEISALDMLNVVNFAARVVSLTAYRDQLASYLTHKMDVVAPNLAALVGETVAARLISRAGSLTNLSKAPASTVQILGAEKALFRALKDKSGRTPKYGLIYHSTFIGRAGTKNKGRISRYLANKCSIASRIDCFWGNAAATGTSAEQLPTRFYGEAMRGQVEERLKFYEQGICPRTNAEVMREAGVLSGQQQQPCMMDIDEPVKADKKSSKKSEKKEKVAEVKVEKAEKKSEKKEKVSELKVEKAEKKSEKKEETEKAEVKVEKAEKKSEKKEKKSEPKAEVKSEKKEKKSEPKVEVKAEPKAEKKEKAAEVNVEKKEKKSEPKVEVKAEVKVEKKEKKSEAKPEVKADKKEKKSEAKPEKEAKKDKKSEKEVKVEKEEKSDKKPIVEKEDKKPKVDKKSKSEKSDSKVEKKLEKKEPESKPEKKRSSSDSSEKSSKKKK